jgi:hypothetical protein
MRNALQIIAKEIAQITPQREGMRAATLQAA